MKFNKIFAAALAVLTMTACSDDDPVNTADVTVSMGKTEMSVSEDISTGVYYYVPVVLSGETNGPVSVTIEVDAIGNNPAKEGVDYLFTSKTITIPAGQTEGVFEFHPNGDDIVNEDREFTVNIVSATGAKIGAQSTTLVKLLDNEHLLPEAYAKVIGTWTTSGMDGNYDVKIVGYDEGDPNYLKKVKLQGIFDTPIFEDVVLSFELDGSTGLINLTFDMPQVAGTNLNFNGIGVSDVVLIPYDGSLYLSGSISATSDEEVTMFNFDGGVAAAIFKPGNYTSAGFTGYVFDRTAQFSLTKVGN